MEIIQFAKQRKEDLRKTIQAVQQTTIKLGTTLSSKFHNGSDVDDRSLSTFCSENTRDKAQENTRRQSVQEELKHMLQQTCDADLINAQQAIEDTRLECISESIGEESANIVDSNSFNCCRTEKDCLDTGSLNGVDNAEGILANHLVTNWISEKISERVEHASTSGFLKPTDENSVVSNIEISNEGMSSICDEVHQQLVGGDEKSLGGLSEDLTEVTKPDDLFPSPAKAVAPSVPKMPEKFVLGISNPAQLLEDKNYWLTKDMRMLTPEELQLKRIYHLKNTSTLLPPNSDNIEGNELKKHVSRETAKHSMKIKLEWLQEQRASIQDLVKVQIDAKLDIVKQRAAVAMRKLKKSEDVTNSNSVLPPIDPDSSGA